MIVPPITARIRSTVNVSNVIQGELIRCDFWNENHLKMLEW